MAPDVPLTRPDRHRGASRTPADAQVAPDFTRPASVASPWTLTPPVDDPQRAARLFERVASQPAEWQIRTVAAGPLSWQEIQDNLRRQADAAPDRVDVYRVRADGGRDAFLLVHSNWESRIEQRMRDFARDVITETAKSAVDAWLGVPLFGLLDLPTNASGALFYAIGLRGLAG